MESRPKHLWEDDTFLIEQLDYIMDRVLVTGVVFLSCALKDTPDYEIKWERLLKLYGDCQRVNVGKEGKNISRDFIGKFARILKLITNAYLEACKISDDNELKRPSERALTRSSEGSPRLHGSPRLLSSPRLQESPRLGESPRTGESPRVGESPRLGESPRAGESPRLGESPRSPRLDFMRRSMSSIRIRPPSVKIKLTGNEDAMQIAAFINGDFNKHHYARVLGLLLGEIYRLMDKDILPSLREADKQSIYYQSAVRLVFPFISHDPEDYDYLRNMYERLKLPDTIDAPEAIVTRDRGKTM